MKKKLVSALKWCLIKLEPQKKEFSRIININSEFQTKKKGIGINEAKGLVIGQCLSQAKRHVSIGVVSGHGGYEKIVGSFKIQTKLR